MRTKASQEDDQNRIVGIAHSTISELGGRGRLPVAAAVLSLLVGGAIFFAWENVAPSIVSRGEYRVSEDRITITPQPEWLIAAITKEVVRDGSLDAGVSILDDDLAGRVIDAFELHPWVRSVERVQKVFPAELHIDLTYREPVATVVVSGQGGVFLSPVDPDGVRLPAEDMKPLALRTLLRIGKTEGPPPVGQSWLDERVLGGCRLAKFLKENAGDLSLVDILPAERSDVYKRKPFFVYSLVTSGGTQIVWGAAPGGGPPDEPAPDDKLARLRKYVSKYGALTGVESPETINVRYGLETTPRSARKNKPDDRSASSRN